MGRKVSEARRQVTRDYSRVDKARSQARNQARAVKREAIRRTASMDALFAFENGAHS